jgi:hypothetical protein
LTASGCSVSGKATVRRRGRTGSSDGSVGGVDSAISAIAAESELDARVGWSLSLNHLPCSVVDFDVELLIFSCLRFQIAD